MNLRLQPPVAAGKAYNITAGQPVMYKEFFGKQTAIKSISTYTFLILGEYVGGLCEGPKSFWGHAKPKSIPVWLASALATMNELTYQSLGIILFAKSFTR